MKSVFSLAIFSFMLIVFLSNIVQTYPNKPPTGVSGLTGGANCTSCHGGSVNSGPGKLSFQFSDSLLTYRNDSTYSITVTVTQNAFGTFGHEMAIVDSNYNSCGTLTVTNTSTQYAFNSGGVLYGSHKNANSTNTWIYKWKAPSANLYKGKIFMGCSGMAANSNGRTSGDYTYVKNIIIQHAKDSSGGQQNGISAPEQNLLQMHWIGNGEGFIEIESPVSGNGIIYIYDLSGKMIYQESHSFQGGLQRIKPMEPFTNCIYIVNVSVDGISKSVKFVIM